MTTEKLPVDDSLETFKVQTHREHDVRCSTALGNLDGLWLGDLVRRRRSNLADSQLMASARAFQAGEVVLGNRVDLVAGVISHQEGGLKKYKLRDELGNTEEFERRLEDLQSEFEQRGRVTHDNDIVDVTANEDDAESLLRRIEAKETSVAERCRLVLECETVAFSSEQKPQLCRLLSRFVEDFRDSQNAQELVSVSSAIRKLVFNVPAEDLESLVAVLSPGHRAAVSEDIELEVSKSIVRRLTAYGVESCSLQPAGKLVESLEGLVCDYLRDRLLTREKYGVIALNSLMALTLMGHRSGLEVTSMLRSLRSSWFKTLLARRANRIAVELLQRFGDTEQGAISRLRALIAAATPS